MPTDYGSTEKIEIECNQDCLFQDHAKQTEILGRPSTNDFFGSDSKKKFDLYNNKSGEWMGSSEIINENKVLIKVKGSEKEYSISPSQTQWDTYPYQNNSQEFNQDQQPNDSVIEPSPQEFPLNW